ncbi:MAG TPA: D-alanyl-D-alanine carboxypeptidase family protein, partial [Alphaproteobacteria bacterium]|nr:D-alanyl-D-alanine carboxypeptidase family protein [Alphaproteobacteria bacterium]
MRLLALFALSYLSLTTASWATQNTVAKQAIVVDYETGQVLLEKNADEKMPTSSMSKVMTMYVVFDALRKGIITMDSEFNVSEKAWRKGGSKMFVPLGKNVKVKDLIQGVIVQSGNDATIVLAEGLSGTEDAFAKALNEKAAELGMTNSHFANASGWPDPDHYSTARDLATLGKAIYKNFPDYHKFFAEKEYTYNNITQQNRNPLLYRNIGADGLKTGHTEIGGYGLMGTGENADGRRVVLVLNGMADEKERANESARLMEWALNGFTNVRLVQEGQKVSQAPVMMGVQDSVPLIVPQTIKLTVPKMSKDKFTVDIKYKTPLIAPIKEGQEVGSFVVNVPDMEPMTYPLLAAQGVDKVG